MKEQKKSQQANHNSFRIKTKSANSRPIRIGHYQIGELIGKGGFANVYRAIQMHSKSEVAIKVINLETLQPHQVEHIRKQIFIHSKLSHSNIVKIYEAFWTETEAYIVMEYVKGFELFSYLSKFGALPEAVAAKIFYQMINATQYLHSLNIAHRDIKTENIIIDFDFNAKLLDFGLAKYFKSSEDDHLKTLCGSPSYIAPQILYRKGYSGQGVDIWCLGVTLYVMLQACLPFEEPDDSARETNIKNMDWHYPLHSSCQAREIYSQIFVEQDQRITIEGLKNSEFLQNYKFSENLQCKNNKKKDLITNEVNRIISKISKLLRLRESEVLDVIENKKIGEIFCLYSLFTKQSGITDEQLEKRKCQSEQKQSKSIFEQEKSSKRAKTKPKQTICDQKPKTILPNVFETKAKTVTVTNQKNTMSTKRTEKNDNIFESFAFENSLVDKDVFSKQMINTRVSKFRVGKQQLKIATPRLRNNDVQSPKRILDCVKRYN